MLARRKAAYKDHFMPVSVLERHLATLRPPDDDETEVFVDIDWTAEAVVAELLDQTWRIRT